MPDIKISLSGGCLCGRIRYSVDTSTETRQLVLCHCNDCQKATGTGHSQTLGIPEEDIIWEGQENLRTYTLMATSGNPVENCFCGNCGAPVGRRYEQQRPDIFAGRGRVVALHAGSLDQDCIDQYKPDFKIFLGARPGWDNYF